MSDVERAMEAATNVLDVGCCGDWPLDKTRLVAADAITAFLRALPNEAMEGIPGVLPLDASTCRRIWAAAVEAAASRRG